MRILHWVVMVTALITTTILWLPMYVIRKLFLHSVITASRALEKCTGTTIEPPIN